MKLFTKILIILLTLIPLSGKSQKSYKTNPNNVPTYVYQNWDVANNGQWGSFWLKIERTNYKVNGYYYYFVYTFSNSQLQHNNIVYKASTFVDHINVSMYWSLPNGTRQKTTHLQDATIFDWETSKICYFITSDPRATFKVHWQSVYPYDYSKVKQ